MPSGISIHWLNLLVMGHDKIAALANSELADHGEVSAAQNLTISPSARPSLSMLAMWMTTRSPCMAVCADSRGDVDIAAHAFNGMVGNQESVAIAMHVQAADAYSRLKRAATKWPGADFDDFAAFDQAIERLLHFVAR